MNQQEDGICKYFKQSTFFDKQLSKMPSLANMLKQQFCYGDYVHCARYLVREKLGSEKLPPDLYPNDIDRGKSLVGLR